MGTAADLIRLRSLIAAAANIKHRTALAVSDRASYFVYFGSRVSQPARARAFIDLAVRRWVGNDEYVLSETELRASQAGPALGRATWSPEHARAN